MSNSRVSHVTHVVDSLELGGMERMIQTLCTTALSRGIRASVLCLRRRGVIADELEVEGVEIVCLHESPRWSSYLAMFPVARLLRSLAPDVVHTHNTSALLFGATGARIARISRVVHTDHGRSFPDRWHRMLGEWVASHCTDFVVGVAAASVADLHRYEHIAQRKLRVVPNGVRELRRNPLMNRDRVRSQLGVSDDDILFGLAARLVWEKGLDCLLRAFARSHRLDPRVRLVVAGDGPQRRALNEAILELGIGDVVSLIGPTTDVPSFLNALDVYVLSSVSEGLPMGLLEAMAAGRAIVATDVGGVSDALGHGQAGLVVRPSDVHSLSDAMVLLAGDSDLRTRLGQMARQRYVDSFTAVAMLDRYLELYRA